MLFERFSRSIVRMTQYTQQRAYEDKIGSWIEKLQKSRCLPVKVRKIPFRMEICLGIKRLKLIRRNQKRQKKTSKADSKTPKADSKKSAKDWTEEETTMLIEILESKPYLWDVHHAEYSKRDNKEIAYSEMASNFDISLLLHCFNQAEIEQFTNTFWERVVKRKKY